MLFQIVYSKTILLKSLRKGILHKIQEGEEKRKAKKEEKLMF